MFAVGAIFEGWDVDMGRPIRAAGVDAGTAGHCRVLGPARANCEVGGADVAAGGLHLLPVGVGPFVNHLKVMP